MVLFDQVIEILDLPEFTAFRKESRGFELGNGFGIGRILIDIDHSMNGFCGGSSSRHCELGHRLFDEARLGG
ncbi:MAG: hypothetical protein NVSMB49_29100 [Ktedonobacteraceae bacterium]